MYANEIYCKLQLTSGGWFFDGWLRYFATFCLPLSIIVVAIVVAVCLSAVSMDDI